jgi:hypothetical protein
MVSLLPPKTIHIPFSTAIISEINPWQIGIDDYIIIIDKKYKRRRDICHHKILMIV